MLLRSKERTLSQYFLYLVFYLKIMIFKLTFLFFFLSGISSLTFTKAGEALYLHSSSELQRISLSAAKMTKAHCVLNLPPHARTYTENSNEVAQEQGVVEGVPETEGETQGSQTPTAANRIITENGVVNTSEYANFMYFFTNNPEINTLFFTIEYITGFYVSAIATYVLTA